MGQLSFFSAETDEPSLEDLSGLFAAHGQSSFSPAGSRVSIVVDAQWRADALVEDIELCGVRAHPAVSDEGSPMARTETSKSLDALTRSWVKGAVKTMPADWVPSPRALRLWAIAAGRREEDRYLLGLDPHAPETHSPLATALMRAGIAPTLVGTRGHSPALRIAGRRRLSRLLENIGAPPGHLDAVGFWPTV
ncbi:hypothetical protein ASG12_04465 [Williamsia sp. Leaf354]|uniref:Uncharacterized protein n=1 Tax=Williamsia herbipolensis TaxID=1603258 RepID=A0AAU4JZA5_9NOCA|nr:MULTISPECIES: hypothetical protein [Williamsia]KQS00203.1 hypothetical protein ASG12_04465 [Williamsia sp. Leaf354]